MSKTGASYQPLRCPSGVRCRTGALKTIRNAPGRGKAAPSGRARASALVASGHPASANGRLPPDLDRRCIVVALVGCLDQAQAPGSRAKLEGADLSGADLVNADLHQADLSGANLDNADLRNTNLQGIQWKNIRSIAKANIHAVRNAPEAFEAWAIQHHAISLAGEE